VGEPGMLVVLLGAMPWDARPGALYGQWSLEKTATRRKGIY